MTAHRYWRLDVSATQGGAVLAVAELILRTTIGGSDAAAGCTASASTTGSTNTPAKAFDGSAATNWQASTNAEPQWLKADLGSAMAIVEYAITNSAGAVATSPKSFTLSYSDDDIGYTVADTQSGLVWASVGQTKTFDISSGTPSESFTEASTLGSTTTTAAFQETVPGGDSFSEGSTLGAEALTAGFTETASAGDSFSESSTLGATAVAARINDGAANGYTYVTSSNWAMRCVVGLGIGRQPWRRLRVGIQ